MKASQAEIQAIQARLQEIGLRPPYFPPSKPVSPAPPYPPEPQATASGGFSADGVYPDYRKAGHPAQAVTPGLRLPGEPGRDRQPQPPEVTESGARATPPTRVHPTPPFRTYAVPQQQLSESLKRLEAQVRHINELSAIQEAAMLELKAIAEQVQQDQNALDAQAYPRKPVQNSPAWVCEYLPTAVPKIERDVKRGSYVVTARSIDLLYKEHEAEQAALSAAETIRQFANRPGKPDPGVRPSQPARSPSRTPSRSGSVFTPFLNLLSDLFTVRPQRVAADPVSEMEAASSASISVQEGVLWVVGSAIARMGLDAMLVAFPTLWLPVVALVVTPAAIAIYRTTIDPQSGLMLGYRLLLIMVGLLIGGRF